MRLRFDVRLLVPLWGVALLASGDPARAAPVYLECSRTKDGETFKEQFLLNEEEGTANLISGGKGFSGRAVFSLTEVSFEISSRILDVIYTIDRRTLAYTFAIPSIDSVSGGTCQVTKPEGVKF